MISGVHHLAIQVRDLAVCERFYREVLGLSVLLRWPTPDGQADRSVWLNLGEEGGGAFLALETAGPDRPLATAAGAEPDDNGLRFFALRIRLDERATWEETLAIAGVPIVHRTAYTLYFHDPEGNRLGLSHYPDAHPPLARNGPGAAAE